MWFRHFILGFECPREFLKLSWLARSEKQKFSYEGGKRGQMHEQRNWLT